ncbi:MAG: phage baseplate assembly protein V [Candidatus Methanoperedens sp.]|nr:phage baseplate assembly protein V [Candidatus Methanoperedens sp.]MCZ7369698.1 phage baseplate assembly protein V [Candidatus Methanoperedens sp.]
MSITGLLEQRRRSESKIYGVVTGIVIDNKDPDMLGRVKVKIPRLSGEDESNWARVLTFMAGSERGAFFLPEVDDEVLVAFEYGDINIPYIIGSLWNGVDTPILTNEDGENSIRMIKSKSGHIIRFDDTNGGEKIEIIDKSEKNMIVISTSDNKISIKSDMDIEISAPNGKVAIEANDFEVKTKASAKIEANDFEVKAKASVKIEATSSMDLKASGSMNVKGATVNIN